MQLFGLQNFFLNKRTIHRSFCGFRPGMARLIDAEFSAPPEGLIRSVAPNPGPVQHVAKKSKVGLGIRAIDYAVDTIDHDIYL